VLPCSIDREALASAPPARRLGLPRGLTLHVRCHRHSSRARVARESDTPVQVGGRREPLPPLSDAPDQDPAHQRALTSRRGAPLRGSNSWPHRVSEPTRLPNGPGTEQARLPGKTGPSPRRPAGVEHVRLPTRRPSGLRGEPWFARFVSVPLSSQPVAQAL